MYRVVSQSITTIKSEIAQAVAFEATGKMLLETVFAGSVSRVTDQRRCALDWALIEIQAGREGINQVSIPLISYFHPI